MNPELLHASGVSRPTPDADVPGLTKAIPQETLGVSLGRRRHHAVGRLKAFHRCRPLAQHRAAQLVNPQPVGRIQATKASSPGRSGDCRKARWAWQSITSGFVTPSLATAAIVGQTCPAIAMPVADPARNFLRVSGTLGVMRSTPASSVTRQQPRDRLLQQPFRLPNNARGGRLVAPLRQTPVPGKYIPFPWSP